MGNIRETTGETVKTVVKVEKCGHSLSKEREPKLGGELDADGHCIQNVADIDCETINGENLNDKLDMFFADLREQFKGYALKDHEHADIKESLKKAMDQKADKDHTHPEKPHTHDIKETTGTLSLSRVEKGSQLSSLLERDLAAADHGHIDLALRIEKVEQALKALPKPEKYDDTDLRKELQTLSAALHKVKPVTHVAEVTITPVEAPSVTVKADYLIVTTAPDASVADAKGQKGAVKTTESGKRFLIRGVFASKPVQPLTFTFSTPPTLCGIGVSTENKGS